MAQVHGFQGWSTDWWRGVDSVILRGRALQSNQNSLRILWLVDLKVSFTEINKYKYVCVCWLLGCFYHGHNTHCDADVLNPQLHQTMGDLYRRTIERETGLRKAGYSLKTMWECTFDKLISSHSSLEQFCKDLQIRDRLDPRNSLYGGRTNAVRLEYSVKEGERILYKDVVSGKFK